MAGNMSCGRILCSQDHLVEYFARMYAATLIAIQMHPDKADLLKELDFTREPMDQTSDYKVPFELT